MPSKDKHLSSYSENRKILNTTLNIDTCDHYNWIITISFYAALHLVERKLSDYNLHTPSHNLRGKEVHRFSDFRRIRVEYAMLHDRSIAARYNCVNLGEAKAREMLHILEVIENELLAT